MSRIIAFLSLSLLFFACQQATGDQTATVVAADHPIQADLSNAPAWEKDNFRLVPLTASSEWIAEQENLAQYKVLNEALELERFRITEKKPYGRFDDAGAVNTLTVQNKTDETIFLMAGEVVQGGNQDRVLAENVIIPPASIQDIHVFCVEKGRWTYEGDHAINEADKKVFAFRGYYNVAPGAIRKSASAGNQSSVWENVAQIREAHGADNKSTSYADLESNSDLADERNSLELFFGNKLTDNENIIGFIALKGNKVIGADVFGHPTLLNRQFDGLLHGYITDALASSSTATISDERLAQFSAEFIQDIKSKGYSTDGLTVHHSWLP